MVWRCQIRAFLDSNVWYSGLHSPQGAPGKVIALCAEGKFHAVVSRLVLEEVIGAIKSKMPEKLNAFKEFLLLYPPEICPDPSSEKISQYFKIIHTEDAPILAAAIAAKVDYLVSGDRHFLPKVDSLKEKGVMVVSPGEFERRSDNNGRKLFLKS